MAGEDATVGRDRLGVAPFACLGQHHVDAAPVHVAAAAFDQAVPGQPVHQAGQRALAQVHGLGEVLGAELAPVALGQPLEDLEVADPEPVPLAELALQRGAGGGVAGGHLPPGGHHLVLPAGVTLALPAGVTGQRAGITSQVGRAATESARSKARATEMQDIVDRGYVIIGSPDEVVAQLTEVATQLNVAHLMLLLQFGNMNKQLAQYNTKLFAEAVMPKLKPLFAEWEDKWWPQPMEAAQRAQVPAFVPGLAAE